MSVSLSLCGADCAACPLQKDCSGCVATGGKPFGGSCPLADCCRAHRYSSCADCPAPPCATKQSLLDRINALHIPGLPQVQGLNALRGSFLNLEYTLPGGQKARFLDDDAIYLGTQIPQPDGTRCYGLCTDGRHFLLCEYGEGGTAPTLLLYCRL